MDYVLINKEERLPAYKLSIIQYAIVAVLLVLIFIWGPIPATHRLAGIIVFSVLALGGTEVLRRQIERDHGGRESRTEAAPEVPLRAGEA